MLPKLQSSEGSHKYIVVLNCQEFWIFKNLKEWSFMLLAVYCRGLHLQCCFQVTTGCHLWDSQIQGEGDRYLQSLFFQILWGKWTGNHPQENLAKFGYKSERKVNVFWNLTILWWHARTYHLNLTNFLKIPRNIATLGHFPPINPLYRVATLYFWSPIGKNSPHKRTQWLFWCHILTHLWLFPQKNLNKQVFQKKIHHWCKSKKMEFIFGGCVLLFYFEVAKVILVNMADFCFSILGEVQVTCSIEC
jgi:hypothetical protein